MKKILFIIVGAVLAILLVGIGWVIGAQSKFLTQAYSITITDKSITDLSMSELLLQEINTGKIDDAKCSLQMQINVDILTVNSLIDYSDKRSRDLARKIFTRIAHDRAQFPNNYSGDLPKMDSDVDAKIKSILKQSSDSHKKE